MHRRLYKPNVSICRWLKGSLAEKWLAQSNLLFLFRLSRSPDPVSHVSGKPYQVSLKKMLALFLMRKSGVARVWVCVLMLPGFLCNKYFLSSHRSKMNAVGNFGIGQTLGISVRYSTRSTCNSFVTWKAPSTASDVTSKSVQIVPDAFVNVEGPKGNKDNICSFPPISEFSIPLSFSFFRPFVHAMKVVDSSSSFGRAGCSSSESDISMTSWEVVFMILVTRGAPLCPHSSKSGSFLMIVGATCSVLTAALLVLNDMPI